MNEIRQTIRSCIRMIMEINEASFPWYAGITTVILVFRLFSQSTLEKIGISVFMIMGFFGVSAVLKIGGGSRMLEKIADIPRIRHVKMPEKGKKGEGRWKRRAGVSMMGVMIGCGIAGKTILDAHDRISAVMPEYAAWVLWGGIAICAIGAIAE